METMESNKIGAKFSASDAVFFAAITCLGLLGVWLIVKLPLLLERTVNMPQLWYLNWQPAWFSTLSFAYSVGTTFMVALLCIGFVLGFAYRSITAMLVALTLVTLAALWFSPVAMRYGGFVIGAATEKCQKASSFGCRINQLNRAYDLGIDGDGITNSTRYKEYVTLRTNSGFWRPFPNVSQQTHQRELHQWVWDNREALERIVGVKLATPSAD